MTAKVRETAAVRVSAAVDGTRKRRASQRQVPVVFETVRPHPLVWAHVLAMKVDLRRVLPQQDGSAIIANRRVR